MNVLKYSVHWFGNRRKKALTDGQVHNVISTCQSVLEQAENSSAVGLR